MHSHARLIAQRPQTAAFHERTGQRMSDDVFRKLRNFDQAFEIDARVDAHLFAEKHEVFRADIARRAFMRCEWATAEARDRRIENIDAHFHRRICEAIAIPRVSCRCSDKRWSGYFSRTAPITRLIDCGVAHAIVSA